MAWWQRGVSFSCVPSPGSTLHSVSCSLRKMHFLCLDTAKSTFLQEISVCPCSHKHTLKGKKLKKKKKKNPDWSKSPFKSTDSLLHLSLALAGFMGHWKRPMLFLKVHWWGLSVVFAFSVANPQTDPLVLHHLRHWYLLQSSMPIYLLLVLQDGSNNSRWNTARITPEKRNFLSFPP